MTTTQAKFNYISWPPIINPPFPELIQLEKKYTPNIHHIYINHITIAINEMAIRVYLYAHPLCFIVVHTIVVETNFNYRIHCLICIYMHGHSGSLIYKNKPCLAYYQAPIAYKNLYCLYLFINDPKCLYTYMCKVIVTCLYAHVHTQPYNNAKTIHRKSY